jgi:hypothetical protein
MAKSSRRLIWDNYATDAWSATRDGKPLCRIRRGPKSGRWMLLRCVDGKAWLGDVAEWHSDYGSLVEAKRAATKL